MGAGLIDDYDIEKRQALAHDTLRYLVKDEQLVLVKPFPAYSDTYLEQSAAGHPQTWA